MPSHMSNADRIAKAAAEVEAKTKEKTAKKAARPLTASAPRKSRAPKAPPRLKIIWAVGQPGAAPAKTYPYIERAAADAEAVRRGKGCMVTPLKVPMES